MMLAVAMATRSLAVLPAVTGPLEELAEATGSLEGPTMLSGVSNITSGNRVTRGASDTASGNGATRGASNTPVTTGSVKGLAMLPVATGSLEGVPAGVEYLVEMIAVAETVSVIALFRTSPVMNHHTTRNGWCC